MQSEFATEAARTARDKPSGRNHGGEEAAENRRLRCYVSLAHQALESSSAASGINSSARLAARGFQPKDGDIHVLSFQHRDGFQCQREASLGSW